MGSIREYLPNGWPGIAYLVDQEPSSVSFLRLRIFQIMGGKRWSLTLTRIPDGHSVRPRSGLYDLDGAMHSVWLHGSWHSLTKRMTTGEREAAWSAVLRADARLKPDGIGLLDPNDNYGAWWRAS